MSNEANPQDKPTSGHHNTQEKLPEIIAGPLQEKVKASTETLSDGSNFQPPKRWEKIRNTANWSTVFAFIIAVATVVNVCIASKQWDVAKRSADAAWKSANVAEDALTKLERPFLFPEEMKLIRDPTDVPGANPGRHIPLEMFRVDIPIKNYGRSPALLKEYSIRN